MRSQESVLRDKMDVMDWLARNSDYLSAKSIQDVIAAFKELYNTENSTLKNAYIFAKHNSVCMQTLVALLEGVGKLTKDEDVSTKITVYLSILEALLIND